MDTGTTLNQTEKEIFDDISSQHKIDKQYKNGIITFSQYRNKSLNNGNGWCECRVCDWGSPRPDSEVISEDNGEKLFRFFCPLCGSNISKL